MVLRRQKMTGSNSGRPAISIATRTLAVLASLYSSPNHGSFNRNGIFGNSCSASLVSSLFVAVSSTSAFQQERRILPNRSSTGCLGRRRHHFNSNTARDDSFYRPWNPSKTNNLRYRNIRCYHSSIPTTTSFLKASEVSVDEGAPFANGDRENSERKVAETTRHLPRLFIDKGGDNNSNSFVIPLREKSLVPLTVDQEHYLLDVMRITNAKRWGPRIGGKKRKNNDDEAGAYEKDALDYTGCVRIFNGVDGEWLARVVVPEEDAGGGTKNKKQRRKRGGKQKTNSSNGGEASTSSGTVLECLQRLLPQERAGTHRERQDEAAIVGNRNKHNEIASLRLYLGYLKDKQRRRWVIEKATELGADCITILETDFSNNNNPSDPGSYKRKQKEVRWEEDREKHRLHAIEAAEQCERLTVPELSDQAWTIDEIADRVALPAGGQECDGEPDTDSIAGHVWMVCRERSESSPPILSALRELSAAPASESAGGTNAAIVLHVLVGPEGGWSPRELEVFSGLTGSGLRFVSLGSSVLRAETAAVAAVAAVQMHRDADVGRM